MLSQPCSFRAPSVFPTCLVLSEIPLLVLKTSVLPTGQLIVSRICGRGLVDDEDTVS